MQIYKISIEKVCIDVVYVTHVNIVCSGIGPSLAAPCSLGCGLEHEVTHVEAELRAGVGQEVVQEAREVREAGRVQVPGEWLLLGEHWTGWLGLVSSGVRVRGMGRMMRSGEWGHGA